MLLSDKPHTVRLLCLLVATLGSAVCYAQQTMEYVEVRGTKFHCIVEGQGMPTLVLGSSIYYPRTFSDDLNLSLQMYFVDLHWFSPNFSPNSLEELDIERIVEDIHRIKEGLGLGKPLLIGHSIHGTIATEYAKRYPSEICGLVVVASPASWGNDSYHKKAQALWATASDERKRLQEENWGELAEIDRLTGKEEASARYNNMSPQYWYDPRYDAGWLWEDMTVHTAVTTHLFTKVFADYEMFDFSTPLTLPILLVLGKYDYVIPYTLWETSYPQLKDFTHVLFERSGHTPQLEEAALFNNTLTSWIDKKIKSR